MVQHEMVVVVELEQEAAALRLHDQKEGEHYFAIVAVDHHKVQLSMVTKSASNKTIIIDSFKYQYFFT